jgi:site-specific DNA-methyltransferase (adenine-specific)
VTEPYYREGLVTLYHGDCRDVLPQLDDVTAIVSDPPYGVDNDTNYSQRSISRKGGRGRGGPRGGLTRSTDFGPTIVGDADPFDPAHLLGYPRVVLFGANHYSDKLPASPCWLVWDKLDGLTSRREVGFNDQADTELIWTNKRAPARLFSHRWMGMLKASERGVRRVHPTQKPVDLMRWVLLATTTDADVIADPYAGSGSTLLAARDLGRRVIGIEVEERYCEVTASRLSMGQRRPLEYVIANDSPDVGMEDPAKPAGPPDAP